jgi:hypothetical protein
LKTSTNAKKRKKRKKKKKKEKKRKKKGKKEKRKKGKKEKIIVKKKILLTSINNTTKCHRPLFQACPQLFRETGCSRYRTWFQLQLAGCSHRVKGIFRPTHTVTRS